MGNEMGNVNTNGLGASEQNISSGILEPSSSSDGDTAGLRSSDAAVLAELENLHETKAFAAGNCSTSEAGDNLIRMQGMSPKADDEEEKNSHANTILDTGELLPSVSVAVLSGEKEGNNEKFSVEEGDVGVDEMIDKMAEFTEESVSRRSNAEDGSSSEENFMKNLDAHELQTTEKDITLKKAEAHEIMFIDESNVADENNIGLNEMAYKKGEYSKESFSQRPNEEIENDEEGILMKEIDAHEVLTNERDSLLKDAEAHVAIALDEGNVAGQSMTEDGEHNQNGSVVPDGPIELHLDSPSVEHETSIYLKAIDVQMKDALLEEKEGAAEKVSQLEGYEFKPDLTAVAANSEEYSLEKEETAENMFSLDAQIKDEHAEEVERDAEKVSPVERCEVGPNPTTATADHEDYVMEKEEKVDNNCSYTTEYKVDNPINEPEEKDGPVGPKEPIVQIALPADDICEIKSMSRNEHFDPQALQTDKYIDLEEEKHASIKDHFEAESNPALAEHETKETSVISTDRLLGESHMLENSEPQASLTSKVTPGLGIVVEEMVEKAELLIETEDSVAEELGEAYGGQHGHFKEEPSITISVQKAEMLNIPFSGLENTTSPWSGSSELERDWNQADALLCEHFTGLEQACAPVQFETEEHKEQVVSESYPEASIGIAENLGQPDDHFSYECFPEFAEANAKVSYEATEKKETSAESDTENCIVLDFGAKKSASFSLESLNPITSSLNSPKEGKDTIFLLDKEGPSVNQRVADDTKDVTCMTESYLGGHDVNAPDEGTKFSFGNLVEDPVTLETASEVENKASVDEEEERGMHHEIFHESDVKSSGGNDQLVKSAAEPHEGLKGAPLGHDGLGGSNNYSEKSEFERQSMINLDQKLLELDVNDYGDFEKSTPNNEVETPPQHTDNSNKKPEDQLQADSEPQEEVKSIIVEHRSVQHSEVRDSKSQCEEDWDPNQEVPTTELSQETPSKESAESINASRCVVKTTMKSECLAPSTQTQNSDTDPSQHMASVTGPISGFERSGFDVQTSSMKPISAPQILQVKSSKPDSISVDQCVSNATQSRTLYEGDAHPNSTMANAKAYLPSSVAGNEESRQDQLSQQQKSTEEVASTLARTSSDRLRTPLLSLFKDEVNLVELGEKGDNSLKKASDKMWRPTSKKFMATSPRVHEKRKPWSSFFSNCMCCTTVPQ